MNIKSPNLYKKLMRPILITLLLFGTAFGARITGVRFPDGAEFDLDAYVIDGEYFVKSSSLADFLDGEETIDFFAKKGGIDFGLFNIEYSLFSPYVKSGDVIFNIYKPVQFRDGSFLLPIRYLIEVFNQVSPDDFRLDGKKLIVSPFVHNVTGINAFQKLNGILIEIYLKERLRFDAIKTDDSWLYVTISEAKIDSMAFTHNIPVPAVYEVRSYQFDRSGQISIRLRPRDFTFTARLREDPLRIQILVRGEGFTDPSLATNDRDEDFYQNDIDVIVIDPGHGGEDTGAIGPDHTEEKNIVLTIAGRLYRLLLDDRRFKPIMTRQDDTFVPLSERTALANSVGGDMFISLHANASKNEGARGLIVFFLADAKTDQARAAATLENSSIRFENMEDQRQYLTDLDFTLRDMIQTEFQRESADLADIIQKSIRNTTSAESRGVDQAGFFVLDKAYMPAVLLEIAFISNVDDEKMLNDAGFQRKTAEAIYESIIAFKEKYESGKRTSE